MQRMYVCERKTVSVRGTHSFTHHYTHTHTHTQYIYIYMDDTSFHAHTGAPQQCTPDIATCAQRERERETKKEREREKH